MSDFVSASSTHAYVRDLERRVAELERIVAELAADNSRSSNAQPARRRPPSGFALTPAEKQRRYRERLKAASEARAV